MKIKIIHGRGWYKELEGTICEVVHFREETQDYMVKDPLPPSQDPQSGMLSCVRPEDCILVEGGKEE